MDNTPKGPKPRDFYVLHGDPPGKNGVVLLPAVTGEHVLKGKITGGLYTTPRQVCDELATYLARNATDGALPVHWGMAMTTGRGVMSPRSIRPLRQKKKRNINPREARTVGTGYANRKKSVTAVGRIALAPQICRVGIKCAIPPIPGPDHRIGAV